MSYDAIARRYARAIFEIGSEEGQLGPIADQIQAVADTYSGSEELRNALDNPMVEEHARQAIVEEIASRLSAGATTKRALRVVTKQGRLRALPDIARHLRRFVDANSKIVRADVVSAAPMSDAMLSRLRAELERATGNKVVLSHSVDASLIGGVVTRIGDRVIDGSLRTRLLGFRDGVLTTR
jgi:F-type H+-transporting ATPase subunit delta